MANGDFTAHINADFDMLEQDIATFKYERNSNNIYKRLDTLTKSKGQAIDQVNECITAYNTFCDNLNAVYESTADYLEIAFQNLKNSESDSTL